MNFDSSSGNGTHWVAYYKNDKVRVYFGSYGLEPSIEILHYLPYLELPYALNFSTRANEVIRGHSGLHVVLDLYYGKKLKK